MAHAGQNQRKRYFIDKGFQSKFVALLVVFIVSLGIAGILILWLGGSDAPAGGASQGDLDGAIIAMLMVVMVFVLFTVWYGIRFSHRVVGPIYAFNRHLNWVRDGNYTRDLRLRDKDEFQNLAQVFNTMQATLRQRTRDDVEMMARAEAQLAQLTQMLDAGDLDAAKAKELIAGLRQSLESARVKDEGLITQ
jgi:methyl-accepting chemotaxis protein